MRPTPVSSFSDDTYDLPRCVSVGTKKGYSITNCDPFGRVYTMSAYAFPHISMFCGNAGMREQMMEREGL